MNPLLVLIIIELPKFNLRTNNFRQYGTEYDGVAKFEFKIEDHCVKYFTFLVD